MQTMRVAFRPAATSRSTVVTRASAVAAPASIPYKAADGSSKGTQQLALKVAEDSAKGLVHRYLVMVQQNARQVSNANLVFNWSSGLSALLELQLLAAAGRARGRCRRKLWTSRCSPGAQRSR